MRPSVSGSLADSGRIFSNCPPSGSFSTPDTGRSGAINVVVRVVVPVNDGDGTSCDF